MRDLAGNEYDGWVMKMPEKWGGQLATWDFKTTRTALWDSWIGEYVRTTRSAEIKRYRRIGYRPVKVRMQEVKE